MLNHVQHELPNLIYLPDKLHSLLEDYGIIRDKNQDFVCSLGIGKPVLELDHTVGMYNNEIIDTHASYDKKIEVTKI